MTVAISFLLGLCAFELISACRAPAISSIDA
jgi:hypothetical protein